MESNEQNRNRLFNPQESLTAVRGEREGLGEIDEGIKQKENTKSLRNTDNGMVIARGQREGRVDGGKQG